MENSILLQICNYQMLQTKDSLPVPDVCRTWDFNNEVFFKTKYNFEAFFYIFILESKSVTH